MEELNIPKNASEEQELRARFKISCRRCGSEDIAINFENSWGGTDVTGGNPGSVQFGCNGCKQNDFYSTI